MERAIRILIGWIARLLAPDQRAAALGDFEELGVTGWRALRETVGLVVLQQAQLWKRWRPWFALIGAAGVAGAVLGWLLFSFSISPGIEMRTYRHYQVFMNDATPEEVILRLSCMFVVTAVGSWTIAYVLGRVSRRTLWLTVPVLYAMVFGSFPAWLVYRGSVQGDTILMLFARALLPINFPAIAGFLVPAFMGLRRGLRRA